MKKVLGLILLTAATAFCVQTAAMHYVIKALPTASPVPTIDGNASEWPEEYFIDSLQSPNNCYYVSNNPWTPAQVNYKVYACTDPNWVYVALVMTSAANYTVNASNMYAGYAVKINPGGQASAFYINADGTYVPNPSSPYVLNSNVFVAAVAHMPSNNLGCFEFKMDRSVSDPFGSGTFKTSIGMEDNNAAGDWWSFNAIGAWLTGNHTSDAGNPWDNSTYYPTFTCDSITGTTPIGAGPAVEKSLISNIAVNKISVSPNPFHSASVISYNCQTPGFVKVYDLSGKMVMSQAVASGSHSVKFNAENLASGIYVARLTSGASVVETRLSLIR